VIWWVEVAAAAVAISFALRCWLIVRPPMQPKPAAPAPSKPPARDATPDEAMEDMLGKGGVTSKLDDREF
jgi:hypothetical protein